ncbi:MAG: hypothetical protein JF619_07135, partial [Massilia sp.]|nr:hypothetical protein [Massilia sp.]
MALRSVRKLRRGLLALGIALPILFIMSAGIAILQDYRATMAQAESDMRSVAVALDEHAMRTFGEADTLVRIAIGEIGRRALAPTAADERALHDILVAATRDSPLANGAAVLSPDGWIRASAAGYPIEPLDSRDREYYTYLLSYRPKGVLVSRPVASRPSGKWSIPVARRVDNPDGSLKMIVTLGVNMAYFDRFYRGLQLGNSIRLVLVRRDGWVVMETPLLVDVQDRNLADTRTFRMLA